jgi:putative endonuclease
MSDKIKRGAEGEQAAASYLLQMGYEILERNFRFKRSEIDLIVKRDSWLVFVEVKTRSSIVFGHPEEFVNEKKETKILEGAEHYIFEKDWKGPVRYDVIAVTINKNGGLEIRHIEDAFY